MKLTLASVAGDDRPSRKNDFSFLKRYELGNRITAVYCFVQGNGSIRCSASCAVNGVKEFLTFKRPSSWICFKTRPIYKRIYDNRWYINLSLFGECQEFILSLRLPFQSIAQ